MVVGTQSPLLAKALSTDTLRGEFVHILREDRSAEAADLSLCGPCSPALVFDVLSQQKHFFGTSSLFLDERQRLAGEALQADGPLFTLFVLAMGGAQGGPEAGCPAEPWAECVRLAGAQRRASFDSQLSRSSWTTAASSSQASTRGGSQSELSRWEELRRRKSLRHHKCSEAWTSDLAEQIRFLQLALALVAQEDPRRNGLLVVTGEEHWPFFRQEQREPGGCWAAQRLSSFLSEAQPVEHFWLGPSMDMLQTVVRDIREVLSSDAGT